MSNKDILGNTPLFNALDWENWANATYLINQGANTNIIREKKTKQTVLHYVVENEQVDLAKLIIKKKTKLISVKDNNNKTPLDILAEEVDSASKAYKELEKLLTKKT